jgi:hypothetical protein
VAVQAFEPLPILVEFHYEPVFWLKSNHILAYEQLARRPGDFDASFLSELTPSQTKALDAASMNTALVAVSALKAPVFVNAFPENVDCLAHRLSLSDDAYRQSVGLEVNEDVPLEKILVAAKKYPDIWWILDDLDLRKDALDTVANPFLRSLPLTVKFHCHSSINNESHLFDLNMLPPNWTVIVEGVKPQLLDVLKNRGVNFVQGRDLGSKKGNVTGCQHEI